MLRFHIPLIKPDVRFSRIRLSDRISRFCPREAARPLLKPNQRVRLSFVDGTRPVRFSAGVAWSAFELPKGQPRYRAGIEFFDADPDAVNRFCDTNRREPQKA